MATELAKFHNLKSTYTVLIPLALQFLGTNPIDEVRLQNVLCCIVGYFGDRLPGILMAVVQTTETYTLSHAVLVFVLQTLAQSWPPLRFIL